MSTKTTTSANTKHEELTRTLQELAQGLQPGDRFPSQTELMRRFQVSDRTVLRSLEDLRRAGWIVRRHGIGTFVADPAERAPETSLATAPVRTDIVAALATSFASYYKHCVDLMSSEAENEGLAFVCHHARFPVHFEDALPLEALRPRGFVLFSYSLLPVARRLQERGHRVVLVGTPPVDAAPDVPCIWGDQEQGGYLATKHLIDLGHERIAFAYHSEPHPHPLTERLRWRGHLRALCEAERAGKVVEASIIPPAELLPMESDPARAAAFFRRPDAPTAVTCWNDTEGMMLLRSLQRAGVRVPDEVSILGYDNLPDGEMIHPGLSTVDPFVQGQLRAALDLLTRPMPPLPTQSLVFQPTLLLRETTTTFPAVLSRQ
jgi:DNA-binding LacI/PurR family transcriptional regulator